MLQGLTWCRNCWDGPKNERYKNDDGVEPVIRSFTMSRRVQFQTLASPAPAAAPFADSVPEVGTGYKKYLQKLDEMEAKYSRKRPQKKKPRKKKKKRYGKTKRLQRWYRGMKRSKRKRKSPTGLALTKKMTFKRVVNRHALGW